MARRHPRLWDPEAGLTGVERALVVVAHPDDAEFGGAGTIALLTSRDVDVRYLVMTDGASGSSDPEMTPKLLAANRHLEQTAACNLLGVRELEWGGYVDGFLDASVESRRVVAAAIRRHRPQLVITLDPEVRINDRGRINHPDHRAVGDLVLHSINPAASTRLWDESLLAEGLEPWDIDQVWLMGFVQGPDRVDITAHFEDKVAALRCHTSQLGGQDPAPWVRDWAGRLGIEVGVALAEAFRMVPLR